ncbi:hypothetical protein SH668x_003155 [Planctomicrobium sp. SH668]|uniref:hypothetical protein n=1 Tax=Planctomicrobium sp. SH668 TaxID=3448126 RepID=UPI003F5B4F04
MFLTMVTPELVTGSTPLHAFLNPITLVFLTLGYGLPVLLIREFACRRQIGLGGLILCGTAYGIFNEGVLAKTLLLETGTPIRQFDGYGDAIGIGWPWGTFISIWHGFASVVFPIFFTHFFFRAVSVQAWLRTTRSFFLLSLGLVALGSLVFLSDTRRDGIVGNIEQLIALYGIMVLLMGASLLLRRGSLTLTGRPSLLAGILGVSVFVPMMSLCYVAEHKMNLWVFYGLFALFLATYTTILIANGWNSSPALLSFAFGWYFQTAVVSIVVLSGNPLFAIGTAIADVSLLIGLRWLVSRSVQSNLLEQVH